MKLNVVGFGFSLSIVWALCVFLVSVANLIWPGYGIGFLKIVDSIYPGYEYGQWGFGGAVVATLYAAVDGFLGGIVFAWLYNFLTRKQKD